MGHSINHYTTKVGTEKQLNTFLTEITENVYDPQETSCYHGHITVHRNKVYKNYDEALDAIIYQKKGDKKLKIGIRKKMNILNLIPFIIIHQNT